MKKILAIVLCAVMLLGAVGCSCKIGKEGTSITEGIFHGLKDADKDQETEPVKNPETVEPAVEPDPEPVNDPEPVVDPEPEKNDDPVDPEPAIDYDNLFHFDDWKEDFAAAEDKEAFIKDYWMNTTMNTFTDMDTYNLIKSDAKAKQAFLDEFKTQMVAQMEEYLKSSGIEVDDSMRTMIEETVEKEMKTISDSIG